MSILLYQMSSQHGPGVPSPARIRATEMFVGSGSTPNLTFPTGAQAGDTVIVLVGSAAPVTGIISSGWSIDFNETGPGLNLAYLSKTLNSSDITAGDVELQMGSSNAIIAASVCFEGSAAVKASRTNRADTSTSSQMLDIPAGSLENDLIILFGVNRANSVNTIDLGSELESGNTTVGDDAGGVLNSFVSVTGSETATFTYGTPGDADDGHGEILLNVVVG